jgi:hypothetical protein
MINEPVTKLLFSIATGTLLGIALTASPLSVLAFGLAIPVILLAGRGLAANERRLLMGILGAALAARVAIVLALVVIGLPHLNDLAVGSLTGDDAYYLGRAIRARDILFGITGGKYDYFIVLDEYGHTSYVELLSAIQIVFGPTPFSMRILNAVLFLAGAAVLFRAARPAFGQTAAFAGLIVLLFLPSLAWASISLLKESLYFLCSSLLLYACVRLAHRPRAVKAAVLLVLAMVSAWLLADLRRDALTLAASGIALALVLRVVAASRARLITVAAVGILAASAALWQPAIRARTVGAIESAVRIHGGHVFTVGHPYKLLDDEFYKNPAAPGGWPLDLTAPQAGRFVVRAGLSFLVTPWPWEMASRGELAFLPEQLLWYVLLIGLPMGIVAGWQRDPMTTAFFIGFALPTAAAIALTNGNVGTLLRLRGLVTPYILWLGVLGLLTMADRALALRRSRSLSMRQDWALQGPSA